MSKAKRKSDRLLPWFGSCTENAANVGKALEGCKFVGIPFAGGMSEVPFITAKQILANDRHRMAINLCTVIQNDAKRQWLIEQADAMPYHPDILETAQRKAKEFAAQIEAGEHVKSDHEAALAYFVCCWMGRGGNAGTVDELKGSLPIRWNANGGGSNRRYRTAIEALDEWGETFRRCEFTCMDGLEFIDRRDERTGKLSLDVDETGVYVDAPWPDAGDGYLHGFTEDQQRRLATALAGFANARVVVRFGEHPLIRRLYLESDGWVWHPMESRNQANDIKPEFLIIKNGVNA